MQRKLLCLLLFCLAFKASADEAATNNPSDDEPLIVVKGSPLNSASDVDPSQATGPVRVISRNDFDNRTANLSDVLSSQTGVQIRQSGALGSTSSISIRGSTSQQVQVILDGLVLNDPVTGGIDLGKLTLNDIERIQVYPSGAPAQYAQSGIGGVIVLETLDENLEDVTRINLGAGSFGTYKTSLYNTGSQSEYYYWLSLDRQASDNDFSYPNRNEWFNPNDGAETKRRNAEYLQNSLSAKIGHQATDTAEIDGLVQYSQYDQGIPSIQNWRDNRASLNNETLRLQLHYQEQGWLDGRVHSSHRLVAGDINEEYDNQTGRVGLGTTKVRTDTRQLGAVNTASVHLGRHQLTASVDVTNFDFRQQNTLNDSPADNRSRLQVSSSLSQQWQSSNGAWRNQAAVRHYYIDDESEEVGGNGNTTRTSATNQYTGWQFGVSRFFAPSWTLSANLSRDVRIPTLQELYGQQGLFIGNTSLEAEESRNFDVTLRTDQRWGHSEITGYFRKLDPAVVATYDARGVGRYVNLEAEIYGLEMDLSYRINDWWSLFGNATLQESRNTDRSFRTRFDKRLPGIYHQSFMAKSQWRLRPFRFELSYQHDDELYYDSANLLMADPRQLVNVRASWTRIWPDRSESELSAEIRNLTDELYQDYNRFPGPGRSFFINLEYTF